MCARKEDILRVFETVTDRHGLCVYMFWRMHDWRTLFDPSRNALAKLASETAVLLSGMRTRMGCAAGDRVAQLRWWIPLQRPGTIAAAWPLSASKGAVSVSRLRVTNPFRVFEAGSQCGQRTVAKPTVCLVAGDTPKVAARATVLCLSQRLRRRRAFLFIFVGNRRFGHRSCARFSSTRPSVRMTSLLHSRRVCAGGPHLWQTLRQSLCAYCSMECAVSECVRVKVRVR